MLGFAESEVVSLIAQNKEVDDIVHGLNKAVAVKTKALVKRVNGTGPFMMTGGSFAQSWPSEDARRKVGCPYCYQ